MAAGFTVRGARQTGARMDRRAAKLKNQRGANLAAAILVHAWTVRNINAGGKLHDSSRYSWPPLSPVTIARRRKGPGVGSVKPLQDTGRLKGGFQFRATKTKGQVYNAVSYSKTHEQGKGRVPQRKMFPNVKQGRKIVLPAYQHFVKDAIK